MARSKTYIPLFALAALVPAAMTAGPNDPVQVRLAAKPITVSAHVTTRELNLSVLSTADFGDAD